MAAITLSVNKFLGALTNLIAYAQVANTVQSGAVGRLIASSQDIDTPNGDGKVIRFVNTIQPQDLSVTSSTLLTQSPPTVGEQHLSVSGYKYIPLTLNKYLLRGAWVNEEQMAEFTAYCMSVMERSKDIFLYKELVKEYVGYTPTQATQTLTINLASTTGTSTPDAIEAANVLNAKRISKALLGQLREFEAPTSEYNDANVGSSSDAQYLEQVIDRSSLKLVINARYDIDLIVDTFATLFNSGKITEDERWSETIAIPEKQLVAAGAASGTVQNIIGWLLDRKKIQFGYFYNVATSFFDASNLSQNNWLHFSYYIGVVNALPAVKLVANYA